MKNDSENFITNNEKSADAIGERKTNNGFLLAFSLFCASLITKQACRSISASGWLYDTVMLAGDSARLYGGYRNRMPRS